MNSNVRAGSSPALSTKASNTVRGFFVFILLRFSMGTFVIGRKNNDEYKFEFVSRKGKTILVSGGYELRFECEAEIEAVKASLERCNYLRFKTSKGKCFFKLLLNEKVLATSRKYSTELMMQKGIAEVMRQVPNAEVLDFSANDSIFQD